MFGTIQKTAIFIFILLLAFPLQAQEDAQNDFKKNAFKITFLSFITGSAKLTYERVTFPGQSAEFTAGIIGVGFDKFQVNPSGGLIRAGYKFNLLQPQGSALSGLYVKPEYAWSFFDYDSKDGTRTHSSMQTIMGCIGYQQEIKRLILDFYVGTGAGWGEPSEMRYQHGFIERYGWLTLTFSIKAGVTF